jgi:gliding motility-associated lipoprotein GldD
MVKTILQQEFFSLKMPKSFFWILLLSIATSFYACEEVYSPKQIGYNKIDLPPQNYVLFDSAALPYQFERSTACSVLPDRSKNTEPFWVDIRYPLFDADVQITYKPLKGNRLLLQEFTEEVRLLTNKHNIKATQISEHLYKTADGDAAYVFVLGGQIPTQFQFYTTDSNNHFLRGALYFKYADRNDSLQPVIDFISKDMEHLLSTLKWKKPRIDKQFTK